MLCVGYSSIAQDISALKSTHASKQELVMEKAPQNAKPITTSNQPETVTETLKDGRMVTFTPMGQSGNGYGLYGNPRTYLWADPNLNSVVFIHRMTGGTEIEGNSRLAYDVSTDGGTTFTNNVKVYTPLGTGPTYPEAAGRYPQCAIINPEGNTDPANATLTYFAPTLDQSNGGSWGGYTYGVNGLTETDPPAPIQTNIGSDDGFYRLIPNAFTLTQQNVAWYMEPSSDYSSGSSVYTGELIVGKGVMEDGDIIYEETLVEFLEAEETINDSKIAFAPDGQTGYILVMTDSPSDPQPYTSYHPVLTKTTDGGETWSDPIHVRLGGVDGMEAVKYYWSDEILEQIDIYSGGFDRDEVYYNMGFTADLIVDGQGNPHITGIIAIGSEDGWYPNQGAMATWHLYSNDGGENWNGNALYDNIWLEGDIGDITMQNRPYAASTYDGHYLFFSWLDTDLEGAEANTNPNIFVVGYDSQDGVYTDVVNVTSLSTYWYSAFYGSMSQYVFAQEGADAWTCEIPFMFTEFITPSTPEEEVNFYYTKGFTMSMPVGIGENDQVADFTVNQNTPNPAADYTKILVTADGQSDINLTVNNILGQVVYTETATTSALGHTFNLNVSDYESGIYFYTVQIGNKSVTKKMLVK